MDPFLNPFAPGAGTAPPFLAGRDEVIRAVRLACDLARRGASARSFLFIGHRGVGKTVLLNRMAAGAAGDGHLVTLLEASAGRSLADLLRGPMARTLRRLADAQGSRALQEVGCGGFEDDLAQRFRQMGTVAAKAGKAWVLMIDEVQFLNEEDWSALLDAMRMAERNRLPVVFAGGGLPQVAELAGETKASRDELFTRHRLGFLSAQDCAKAVVIPLRSCNAGIDADALDDLVNGTQGYPFYLQVLASFCWDAAEGPDIVKADVQAAFKTMLEHLDEGFFRVRMDRMTDKEAEFVMAMAACGDGPYEMSTVAKAMGPKATGLSSLRRSLIRKGMICSPQAGFLAFTVPLFADYVRRKHAEEFKAAG